MQPIVHLLLSIVAGLGVGLHLENKFKKYLLIFLLALATACIDLDHLLPIYQETKIMILHNVFVFVLLPVVLFLMFCTYERGKSSTIGQRACLLLSVMFIGAMFLDGISENGMPLFYPFRSENFMIGNMGITIDPSYLTLSSEQVIMIIWGAMILGANLVETLIYNDVEGRGQFELGLKSYRTLNKRRKSWLPAVISGMPFIKMQILRHSMPTFDAHSINDNVISNKEMSDYIFDFVDSLPIEG